MTDTILIVDFGSQVTQLIARRVRESGVYSEIVPFQLADEAFDRLKPHAVILSGGPASVIDADTPRAPQRIFTAGVPVLGICYGQQAMVAQLGGEVAASSEREFGRADLDIIAPSELFDGIALPGEALRVWMSHGDRVTRIPEGFEVIGTSANAPFAAIADKSRRL
jgi:GMP synthase (glutamine-hydrolysing)